MPHDTQPLLISVDAPPVICVFLLHITHVTGNCFYSRHLSPLVRPPGLPLSAHPLRQLDPDPAAI